MREKSYYVKLSFRLDGLSTTVMDGFKVEAVGVVAPT